MDDWNAAVEEFSKNLDPEDRKYPMNSKPHDVVNDVVQFEKSHHKSSTARHMSAKIQPMVSAINDYGRALDVLANSSAIIPPLWGSLRVLILVSSPTSSCRCCPTRFGQFVQPPIDEH
jgi:hypothetical protein